VKVKPREIFNKEPIESFDSIELGDVIACSGWSRGRVVEHVDAEESGPVLFLADPDDRYAEGPRRVDRAEYDGRGGWHRYAGLRALWKRACKIQPKGGFKHI